MEIPAATTPNSMRDTSRYTLTVEDASALFANAGVPRSPRSVQRYCKHSVLDSVIIETGTNEKYLIDPASVERRIIELKQVLQTSGEASSYNATSRDTTRHDSTRRDESRQQPEETEAKQELERKIADFESEVDDLRFDSRMNRELAKFVQQQNRELIAQLGEQSRLVGRLETELRISIEAPRANPMETSDSTGANISDVGPGLNEISGDVDNPVL